MRIYFTPSVKIAGWDIVSYLLATSHITEKQEVERSVHIFYQLLQPYGDGICDSAWILKDSILVAEYTWPYNEKGIACVWPNYLHS